MSRLARWVALVIALGAPSAAFAQTSLSNGYCDLGAAKALVSGLPSTNFQLGIIPSCTVTVYLHGTTNLATIYADSSNTPLSNPFTATSAGFWQFWAANSATYDVMGSGGIAPNVYPSPTLIPGGGGGAGGGGSSAPQFSVQFALNNTGAFGSDSTITINPTSHIFQAPEIIVPGTGTGMMGFTSASSGGTVWQTAQPTSSTWYWYWPIGYPGASLPCLEGTPGGIGSWRFCPGGLDATLFTGSDIGAQVNAAIAACPQTGYGTTPACTVYVPPGGYNFSTTMIVPLNTFSGLQIRFDHGAWMHYTGSGDAIEGTLGVAGPNTNGTIIEGGSLWGDVSGSGANGIHILPGNQMSIRDMQIVDFTTGSGILLEGPNQLQIQNNIIQDNKYGIHLIPTFCAGPYPYTCSGTTSGSAYTVNALHVTGNAITNNLSLGIFDDRNSVSGGTTGTLGNTFDGNDLELNGNTCTGGGVCGAIFIDKSTGTVITHNYFEGSPRQIVLGEPAATDYFGCAGCSVSENYFTERTATPYLIEAINTQGLRVEGNSAVISTMNSSNCAYNETAYSSGVSWGAQGTSWGPNQIPLSGGGNLWCQGGVAESLMQGAGSYGSANSNYQPYLAYQNFAANGSVTSESVSIQFVSSESSCFATPRSTNAAGVAQWIDTYVSGGFTFHHPATATMDFDFWCAWKAPPE